MERLATVPRPISTRRERRVTAGPVWPQAQFGGQRARRTVVGVLVGHCDGVPSVRTMRTRCSELPSPICSSAAANKVSTIMSAPRTR